MKLTKDEKSLLHSVERGQWKVTTGKAQLHKYKEAARLTLLLKREFVATPGRKIASQLLTKKVREEEILDDFKTFKKNRRG